MKISVLVPVYNTSKYLHQCLQSLKEQRIQDIEFICINDGSTDHSPEIIREFMESDSRFSVINKENTGYGNSMNIGIRQANGDYIGILESDDFAEPDMFEKLCAVAEKCSPDIVKGNFNECDKYGQCTKNNNMDVVPYEQVITAQEYPQIYHIHPSIWTSIYKKSFLVENDIEFLETPGASFQDIAFSFKALHSASGIVCISDAVMNYRVENYSSSIFNPEKNFCVCDELNEMKRFLESRYERKIIKEENYSLTKQCLDWLLYINYMWNYERLTLPFKYAFLIIIKEEFLKMPKETFQSGMWSKEELGVVKDITQRMNTYYSWTAALPKADPRLAYFKLLNNDKKFEQRAFLGFIDDTERILIYGAGKLGKMVLQFLKERGLQDKIHNFVVTEQTEEAEVEGIPVVCIDLLSEQQLKNDLFLVSVYEKRQLDILKTLDVYGAENIILMNEALRELLTQE